MDLNSVRQMETCTVDFFAQLLHRTAGEAGPGLLVLVKPRDAPEVMTRLLNRLNVRPLGVQRTDEPNTCATSALIVCDSLEDAVVNIQIRDRNAPSIPPLPLVPPGLDQRHVAESYPRRVIDELFSCLLSIDRDHGTYLKSDASRMDRAGLALRRIRRGDPISCTRYPVRHTFMILQGSVILENSHAGTYRIEAQRPIRDAVYSGMKRSLDSFKMVLAGWFRSKPDAEEQNLMSEYKKPFEWLTSDCLSEYCARASGDCCWILYVNHDNPKGMMAAQQLAQRFTATKGQQMA